jgi:hypothetical protein
MNQPRQLKPGHQHLAKESAAIRLNCCGILCTPPQRVASPTVAPSTSEPLAEGGQSIVCSLWIPPWSRLTPSWLTIVIFRFAAESSPVLVGIIAGKQGNVFDFMDRRIMGYKQPQRLRQHPITFSSSAVFHFGGELHSH